MNQALPALSLAPPAVLLSQCLLGEPVRYDGAHKQQPEISQWLLPHILALPLCPEVAAGMGIPRPAIRRQEMYGVEVIALAASGAPLAHEQLTTTCERLANSNAASQAVAAVLKARSPSCGINTSPLFNSQGEVIGLGNGVFAQQLKQRLPDLLMVSEEQLQSRTSCRQFLRLCQLAAALKLNVLTEDWLKYLHQSNAMHRLPRLGLQEVVNCLADETAELHYLELLPFMLRD